MWYQNHGTDNDVVLASRVRLVRNVEGYAFPERMKEESVKAFLETVRNAFAGREGWTVRDRAELTAEEKTEFMENRLISRRFARANGPAVLIWNENRSVAVMAPEEDHIQIRAMCAGLALDDAEQDAFAAESILDEAVPFAFSERYGYMTHDPNELGTGMQMSVLVHLPATAGAGWIRGLAFQLSKEGMTIRSNGANPSEGAYLYQVTCGAALGVTEEETAAKMKDVLGRIVSRERELRDKLDREELTDRAMRDIGILKFATRIGAKELVAMYSELRLGAAMQLISLPEELLDEMLFTCLTFPTEGEETHAAREKRRAEKIRTLLEPMQITHV